ncbi:MAG: hypothetical protein OXH11_03920 [Candidatus Aminicenantes bacterium]|nr:hypothetical protein [Candidatus Aminicenantes bacterium]
MTPELVGIIAASIALGGLMISLFAWLKSDISRLQDGFAQIRERIAHIEGLLKGLRDSITARTD